MQLPDSVTQHPGSILGEEVPSYSYFLFLIMLMIMGSLLGGGLVQLLELVSGQTVSLNAIESTGERNYVRWVSLISHLFTFAIPALITTMILRRRQWAEFLSLTTAPKLRNLYLGGLFILLTFPLAQLLYWLNQQLPLPAWASQMEQSATEMLQALLVMNTPDELLFNIMVMAVVPAVGEELVFRGIVQKKLMNLMRHDWMAVWVTAFVFSAFHLQFEGFFPRLILGAGLGYLYYWTRNLWVPIIAHLLLNGLQLFVTYYQVAGTDPLEPSKSVLEYWPIILVSTLLLVVTGNFLRIQNNKRD